ncbi:hypothetical protein LMQOC1_60204 [Listeria monocytogenes QOC1]|nr:hypothetical protein LMQOC1_60204 [Listeria monocytogenes QOC1]CUL14923.1 hypothetical protein LM701377_270008 [Listeria monocytogenes]
MSFEVPVVSNTNNTTFYMEIFQIPYIFIGTFTLTATTFYIFRH